MSDIAVCTKCHGLFFFDGGPDANHQQRSAGVCPAGGQHNPPIFGNGNPKRVELRMASGDDRPPMLVQDATAAFASTISIASPRWLADGEVSKLINGHEQCGVVGINYLLHQDGLPDTGAGVFGRSDAASGLLGISDSGPGVHGISSSNTGVYAESNGGDGVLGVSHASPHAGVSGINDSGGPGVYAESNRFDGVHGVSHASSHAGVSGINDSGGPGVYGEGNGGDGVQGVSRAKPHAGVSAINDSGGYGLWARGAPAGHFEGNIEVTGAVHFGGDCTVTGDIRLADCAEEFDVVAGEVPEPGTVMVLDDTGAVRVSDRSCDTRVVGIVSGAANYRPAMVLDATTETSSRRPLALMGKAYCMVDASYGAIAVGDLLTTSATPGHAMKVRDRAAAVGAVIGKALQKASAGRTLIPVLVTLQ
jgi:hypothetical protein